MAYDNGKLNTFHLFAGAGGGILADLLLGHNPIGACEIEPYPREVLLQRQRDGILPEFPIWDDICTFDGRPWKGRVDVVCGGFPCQDISAAGKGAGIEGKRSGLWGEMARVIGEIQPRFVFVENSPLLVGRGLAVVLGDLAEMGYDARWCVLGADDAGAPHRRKRIWILADAGSLGGASGLPEQEQREEGDTEKSHHNGCGQGERDVAQSSSAGTGNIRRAVGNEDGRTSGKHVPPLRQGNGEDGSDRTYSTGKSSLDVADSSGTTTAGRSPGISGREWSPREDEESRPPRNAYWITEPELGRVANGVACRVDRLKAIGNGQVPHVAALAWKILTCNLNPEP